MSTQTLLLYQLFLLYFEDNKCTFGLQPQLSCSGLARFIKHFLAKQQIFWLWLQNAWIPMLLKMFMLLTFLLEGVQYFLVIKPTQPIRDYQLT